MYLKLNVFCRGRELPRRTCVLATAQYVSRRGSDEGRPHFLSVCVHVGVLHVCPVQVLSGVSIILYWFNCIYTGTSCQFPFVKDKHCCEAWPSRFYLQSKAIGDTNTSPIRHRATRHLERKASNRALPWETSGTSIRREIKPAPSYPKSEDAAYIKSSRQNVNKRDSGALKRTLLPPECKGRRARKRTVHVWRAVHTKLPRHNRRKLEESWKSLA